MQRILLVDDEAVTRRGVGLLLTTLGGMEVVGEAENAETALAWLSENPDPDLMVTDLSMGAGPDGIQLTRAVKARRPAMPVVVLSSHEESLFAEKAIQAGAAAYVMKDAGSPSILAAVQAGLAGKIWFSPTLCETVLPERVERDGLSALHQQLLEAVGQGNPSPARLAERLGLGIYEVYGELLALQVALGLESRLQLTLAAMP